MSDYVRVPREALHKLAKDASIRAGKNAQVAPELLYASILWTLQDLFRAAPQAADDAVAGDVVSVPADLTKGKVCWSFTMGDPPKRPTGNNADEWQLFLSEWLRVENGQIDGLPYCAVQIAEAIDARVADDARAETEELCDLVNHNLGAMLAERSRADALQQQVEELTRELEISKSYVEEYFGIADRRLVETMSALARIEELTRERDEAQDNALVLSKWVDSWKDQTRAATAQIAALRETTKFRAERLRYAIITEVTKRELLDLLEDLTRAALAATEPARGETPQTAYGPETEAHISRDGFFINVRWIRAGIEMEARVYEPQMMSLSPALADVLALALEQRPVRTATEPAKGSYQQSTDQAIDLLTDGEGDTLTFCSKNVDFNGLPNECVTVNASWTDWQDRDFRADTRRECIALALDAMRKAATEPAKESE